MHVFNLVVTLNESDLNFQIPSEIDFFEHCFDDSQGHF